MKNGKILKVELLSANRTGGFYSAVLELPATPHQIEDAKQKARMNSANGRFHEVSVLESVCPVSFELMRLDTTSVEELNYYARRLAQLDELQRAAHQALFDVYSKETEDGLISVKDLINMTFNLDSMPVVSNVSSESQLGQFVIDNVLNESLETLSDELIDVLDRKKLGNYQMRNDKGVFEGGYYFPTAHYERVEMYDGEHIPDADNNSKSVIFVAIKGNDRITVVALPAEADFIEKAQHELGVRYFEECSVLDVESVIPNITVQMVGSTLELSLLNRLAERYAALTEPDRVKLKAVIEAEGIADLTEMIKVADRLDEYEIDVASDTEGDFYVILKSN